ncbi:DUF58 domain-containing protein [Cytobacillus sp. FSL R7-0696]|uniref:DUF58 domain-containing protein n=1 Tax=Cytobacillus sp. FSL R7-0696 TaxID=2921691 RepID=UPI0030FA18E2
MRRWLFAVKGVWKLVLLFLLLLITFSYAMFQGGFVSWFLFYSFLPFGLYAFALAMYPLHRIHVKRELSSQEVSAGDTLSIRLSIHMDTTFPLFFLVVEDHITSSLQMKKYMLFPGFRKNIVVSQAFKEIPRGEHVFRYVRLKIGDPLGLIEREVNMSLEDRMIVYPTYEEMVYQPFSHQFDQGMTASDERVQRDTSMATGVREYQPGDRFSWINWKTSAKRNEMMVKEFEQRKSHDVYLLMDRFPEVYFEAIVSFTASLVHAILRKGAQVGFLSAGRNRVEFPILGGEGQLQRIFYHLATVKADSKRPLEQVLDVERSLAQQNDQLLLVTAKLNKRLIEKASFYSQKGSVTIFLVKRKEEQAVQEEIRLKDTATSRGIRIQIVHEGQFSAAFSEVRSG